MFTNLWYGFLWDKKMKFLTLSLPSCGALLTTLKAKLPTTKEDQKSPKNKKEEVATKDQQQGIDKQSGVWIKSFWKAQFLDMHAVKILPVKYNRNRWLCGV